MNSLGQITSIRSVEYKYRSTAGGFQLGPINCDLPQGQLIVWTGANGSGKSTLARLIVGEFEASAGSFSNVPTRMILHHQSAADNVFDDLTIGQHLEVAGQRSSKRLDELFDDFPELDIIGDKYPDELSGGQLQLAAFTVLLAGNYQAYVLDEVLNHLSPEMVDKVTSMIRKYVLRDSSNLCIVITHDMEWVQRHADYLVLFEDGKIKKCLNRDKILEEWTPHQAHLAEWKPPL